MEEIEEEEFQDKKKNAWELFDKVGLLSDEIREKLWAAALISMREDIVK